MTKQVSSFLKKGKRSNKIKLYREAEKDLKNYGLIQTQMQEVSEFVTAAIASRNLSHFPSKEEISEVISISCEELDINLKKKYQDLCVDPILQNLKIFLNNEISKDNSGTT